MKDYLGAMLTTYEIQKKILNHTIFSLFVTLFGFSIKFELIL